MRMTILPPAEASEESSCVGPELVVIASRRIVEEGEARDKVMDDNNGNQDSRASRLWTPCHPSTFTGESRSTYLTGFAAAAFTFSVCSLSSLKRKLFWSLRESRFTMLPS